MSFRLSTVATDGSNKLITRFQRANGADVTYTMSCGCSSNCSANTIAVIFLACSWYTFAITPVCSTLLLRSTNTPLASAVVSFRPPVSLSASARFKPYRFNTIEPARFTSPSTNTFCASLRVT